MKLLEGKTSIVTGAARGIGAAVALKLAQHGSNIAFTYVSNSSADKANTLVTELEALGVKAKAYQSNAGNFAACETFVNEVIADFGAIDVCVNNAGISKDNLLLRMTSEQWEDVIGTNLSSVFNMTKQVIRPMMKAKKGSIINMSSIIGIRGNAGQSSYAASKAGVIGFTKSVAHELGSRNIRCNAIAPGFIETDMTHYLQDGDAATDFLHNWSSY
ncbi:MAG: SDR family NAD(P)-dependent oxidoreductase [Chitinophagaceae bacterium]